MDPDHHEVFHLLINLGYLGKGSQLDDILQLRFVSKVWKERMDRCLRTHPAYYKAFRDEDSYSKFPLDRLNFNVPGDMGSEKLKGFVESVLPNHLPSLSRCIDYSELSQGRNGSAPSLDKVKKLRTSFLQLLQKVGTQVLHCKLTFLLQTMGKRYKGGSGRHPLATNACQTDPETLYKLAHSFLRLMPNLRSLELVGGDINDYNQDQHLMTESMKQLMKNQPLPQLSHLVTLKIHRLPNPLKTAALMTYNHVQKLSFTGEYDSLLGNPLFPDSIENVQMPNVNELRVTLCDERDFEKLRAVSSNPVWKLTALQIEFGFTDEHLEAIFRTASHFKTLRHLRIETEVFRDPIHIQEGFHNLRLELPHLHTFKIKCHSAYIYSLDFLLSCNKLRKLELATTIPENKSKVDRVTTIINSHKFWTKMYESNVWIQLPKLDVIKFGISKSKCFREDEDDDDFGEEDEDDEDDFGEEDDDDDDDLGEEDDAEFDYDGNKVYRYTRAGYQSK